MQYTKHYTESGETWAEEAKRCANLTPALHDLFQAF